ncbi:MAG: hypothetical protein NT001_05260 [Candidatus Woesearchaeota archaeon]|nr:hypothetical protein [Candidatus Woesearchaeota archaeon]
MQLGLNLINDERILDLVRDFEEDRSTPQPELLEDDNEEMNKKPAEF